MYEQFELFTPLGLGAMVVCIAIGCAAYMCYGIWGRDLCKLASYIHCWTTPLISVHQSSSGLWSTQQTNIGLALYIPGIKPSQVVCGFPQEWHKNRWLE